ncbi:CDP-diacylglycerol--glycerol-3-phosphate 3-phosphatidyltransferase [Porticoccaceae bacterium]|nr:CDP-diacylglycerol--glycerol-3-phosphate 3-phosphatidyltransferase [Porticoccaceae bacterium]MDA8788672.1 CDP-diacylglycerol--glycerol-3-phosphate 3-phosphatidyltransferase [Porticoccaceae bacterium]MDB2343557.1 CDP-diacylglycerol--glycerol-3-phosphate 3-phosphatidyltransferase [Porticoccaceae bacterium]MDB2664833.1 CDP-diacylglycerol--glycerol-3-phosphate 3-phosphatidyltransferase [Porticoccaceae bacterium]
MWNLPNCLTMLRIAMIPVFIVVYYLPWEWHYLASAAIFGLAALTDWVDGYFARKLNMVTPFGAFLDPVADKLIVTAALVLLLEVHATPWFALPAIVIIGREIVISALREWMSELGAGQSVAVSTLGKVKTWVQMVAIIVLLLAKPEQQWLNLLGFVAIYVAAGLTLWSMVYYIRQALPQLRAENGK